MRLARVTDPGMGYPPGVPATHTTHGIIHALAGLVVFTSLPAACFVLARRFAGDPAWPGWSLYSSISGLLAFAFFAASIGPIPNAPIGLFQRLAIVTGWIWIALLAAHVLRQTRPPQPVGSM